jgi:formylglycine-generating enzyme required for sulfatase activity
MFCVKKGGNLGAMKFCPDCGSSTIPCEQSHLFVDQAAITQRIQSAINSGAVGKLIGVRLSTEISQAFCFIPQGSFIMGSLSGEEGRHSDGDQVAVTITKAFWLAKIPVTQIQFHTVTGRNPSIFTGANLPVESLGWACAQEYIGKLNEKQILPDGWIFTLPTEAQWEYACRGGQHGPYSGHSLDEVGWYERNSNGKTHEGGQKTPNSWGLYDMHGNVEEWCADWYGDKLKGGVDPAGPASGDYRVVRGGSWNRGASACSAVSRSWNESCYRRKHDYYLRYDYDYPGFRPALVQCR